MSQFVTHDLNKSSRIFASCSHLSGTEIIKMRIAYNDFINMINLRISLHNGAIMP